MKRLNNKTAIIYGTGGIGSAVAKAYASAGAKIFLAGRNDDVLTHLHQEISDNGGWINIAQVDLLDQKAIQTHFEKVVAEAGHVDISFNTFGLPQTGIQGTALIDLSVDVFLRPIEQYLRSQFLTTQVALKQMVKQNSGVIIIHTPDGGRESQPFIGGMPSTWSALEALNRSISVEYGKAGIRSVCLLTTAIPETPLIDEVFDIHGRSHGTSYEDFTNVMNGMTHRNRLTSLEELTNAAIFIGSDDSTAISGTILNLTAGMITV